MLADAGARVDVLAERGAKRRARLLDAVHGVAGVIATMNERVDGALLDAAGPSLKIVANYAVGYDNIDLPACGERGVRVTNTPGVLTEATADLAWALILAASRRVVEGDGLVRGGGWEGWSPTQLLGLELNGATLGIVGAGRIGTAVAMRAVGFGMRVLYCHPRGSELLTRRLGGERVELGALCRQADVLTLHVPMRPENRHLIDGPRIASMKPGAILINTARGPIVDEAALVKALRERRIAAAGLDVYENEPRLTPGLAELPNVVLLPHLGSATESTRRRMSEMAANNVIAVLRGETPPNAVN
jgi:glyoxylate reductase